ncbi:MAG: DUF1292 domain-containing protein [Firmicutes bacterium]|nr:DUF1292 domain-containing protein [Bacillota bacterium]
MFENGTFEIMNDEGSIVQCDVLFTFDSDETKKSYVVFTDNSLDEDGGVKVFANTYEPGNPNGRLGPIETDREWDSIEVILETLQESVRQKMDWSDFEE